MTVLLCGSWQTHLGTLMPSRAVTSSVHVQLFDLGPTILERVGITPDASFETESLNPVLESQEFTGRSHLFCEQASDVNMTGASYPTMVHSKSDKPVNFLGPEAGQLFDLEAYSGKSVNLWKEPSKAGVKRALLREMLKFHVASAVRIRNARHLSVSPPGEVALP